MEHPPTTPIDPLRIVLFVAGAFAIGSVGFFLAVLLNKPASAPMIKTPPTAEEKNKILEDLTASDGADASSSGNLAENPSTASTTNLKAGAPVTNGQADPKDQYAAEKINILDSLNSSQ